jgi:hypothetical protein
MHPLYDMIYVAKESIYLSLCFLSCFIDKMSIFLSLSKLIKIILITCATS